MVEISPRNHRLISSLSKTATTSAARMTLSPESATGPGSARPGVGAGHGTELTSGTPNGYTGSCHPSGTEEWGSKQVPFRPNLDSGWPRYF